MRTNTVKTTTSAEILQRLLSLVPGKTFSVSTKSERTIAQRTAKTLRDCGRIEHTITSRENESGEFVFFVVQ